MVNKTKEQAPHVTGSYAPPFCSIRLKTDWVIRGDDVGAYVSRIAEARSRLIHR